MRHRWTLALVLIGATAQAQTNEDAMTELARQHFEAGRLWYEAKGYQNALLEFEAAYRLQPSPELLIDLGQAARLAGEATRALDYYRRYLRAAPDAADRAQVQSLIDDLERQIAVRAPPPPTTPAAETAPLRAAPDRARVGRGARLAGIGVGAGGLGLLAAALTCALLANAANDALSRPATTPGATPPVYDAALDRRAHAEQDAAIALGTIGGAALVGGAVAFALGLRERRHARAWMPTALLPAASARGASLVAHFAF